MMASRGGWRRRVRPCGDLRFFVGLVVWLSEVVQAFVLFPIVCFSFLVLIDRFDLRFLARSFLDTPIIHTFLFSHGSAFLSPYKLGRSMHFWRHFHRLPSGVIIFFFTST